MREDHGTLNLDSQASLVASDFLTTDTQLTNDCVPPRNVAAAAFTFERTRVPAIHRSRLSLMPNVGCSALRAAWG